MCKVKSFAVMLSILISLSTFRKQSFDLLTLDRTDGLGVWVGCKDKNTWCKLSIHFDMKHDYFS